MIQSGQILNAINLNSAFVSTSYNNQIITGIKKFSNDLYSTKLIASTSDWNKQLILTHDGTDANITTSIGNIVLKTSNTGNVVFKNSSTATEDIVFRVDSSFAGITLNADKANTSGEPGGAYILFLQDGALTKASIGLTQAIGKDSTGNTFANTLDNAFVIGTQTSNPIQIGSNNSVALTVDISNNVGIGTTSPTSKLEVNGVVKATTFTSTATSGAPFSVSSSERVLNLNADMVDGVHVDGLVLKSGDTMTGKLTINSGDSSNGIIETSNINKWIWKLSNYNVGEYWDTTNNNIELRSYYGKVRLIGGNNGTPGTAVEIDNSGKVTSSGLDFVSDNTSTIGTSSKRASGIYSKQYSAYNLNTLDNSFVSYRNTQGAISDTNNHIYTESGYDLFSGNTIYSAEAGSQIIDYVYYYNGSTYTDLTTNIEHNATNQTVLSATGHYIYVGDSSTFSRLYIQIGSSGSGVALKVEYYNGSAWTTLTTTDNTSNLTLSGWLTWTTPGNWAATTVNGQSKYWVRISTTSTPTTAPQIRGINVSLFSGNFINLYAHGYEKLRINNRGTIYSAGTIYPGTASQGTSVQTNNYISGTSTGIGINTTSPSEMLHVVGDVKIEGSGSTIGGANVDNGYIVLGTSTKMGIDNNEIMVDGDHLYIGSKTMATIFRVGTTEYARLNNDGKFGIGTTLPAELLHVAGKARVENLSLYSVSQAPVLYFNAKYNSGDKYIANGSAYQLFHDTDNNKLRFRSAASGTADAAITFNEGLVIDTSGNVGVKPTIDTTSLPYGLTVNATLGMINGNNIELKASSGSPDDAGDIIFYNNGGTQKGKIWTATDTTSQLFISGSDTTADLTVKDNEVQVRRKLSIIGDYTGGTDYYPAIHFNHNSLTDKKVLAVYGGDGNGYGMYLESGAALIIGSGESAGAAYPNLTATAEELWLTSDNGITLMTNIQSGYANRKVITIGTDGVVNFANTNMTSTDRLVFNNTSGGWTGLKFNSGVNAGSDYGYIRYYDDASTLSSNYDINSGSSENSALVIGVENEENSTSGDVLILKGGNRVIIDADTSSRASEDPSYIVDFRAEQVQKAYIDINGNVSANRFISNVATGTSPLQVASTTTVSNLSSDTVDGYHASELYNNTAIKTSTKTNLAVGWYTIAVVAGNGTNSNNRAVARFAIRDIASNRHQEVVFYATHMYGIDSSNTITVLSQASYNITPFRYIRIKENGTYDGAALQVYIDDATNIVTAYILGDNFQANGWIIKDWIADATDPGDVTG
ncbi:MAG: hypothetical protein N2169_05240, partial [bacterium]|nr:hypothetical protein [bacterium]